MVHALKPTRKLGFGVLSGRAVERLHAAVEAGYFAGSLLFTVGTVFFFPLEGVLDYARGCRFYEVGSLIFMVLTFYTEVDGHMARKRLDDGRIVTKRELLEQLLYCLGSFVFLVGTFLFDPPIVRFLADTLHLAEEGYVEDAAAVLFMIGSFMFAFGSYVNGLSIFEAPRMFRKHLITVTTCYQFGGLFFVAGTMGYVDAFKPNLAMQWCATWMYMVGCFFYVAGTGLSFIRTVASQQVSWERKQARKDAKRCEKEMKMANLVGNATPHSPKARGGADVLDEEEMRETVSGSDMVLAATGRQQLQMQPGDLESAKQQLAEQLGAVLGSEDAGQELAAALCDRTDGLLEEEDIFGAFWRSVWNANPFEDVAPPVSFGASHGPGLNSSAGSASGAQQRDHLSCGRFARPPSPSAQVQQEGAQDQNVNLQRLPSFAATPTTVADRDDLPFL